MLRKVPILSIFLSTLSLRRATANSGPCNGRLLHFYPRSPCGERHSIGTLRTVSVKISIHALLAESDAQNRHLAKHPQKFLSTLSLRRATVCHSGRLLGICHFYPRSPCGERPADIASFAGLCNFYPRSPCGERHPRTSPTEQNRIISIHALLAESDTLKVDRDGKQELFLSTLSLRRATSC